MARKSARNPSPKMLQMRDTLCQNIIISQQQEQERRVNNVAAAGQDEEDRDDPRFEHDAETMMMLDDTVNSICSDEEEQEITGTSTSASSTRSVDCEIDEIQILLAFVQDQHFSPPPTTILPPFTSIPPPAPSNTTTGEEEFNMTDRVMVAVYQLALIHGTTLEFIDELFCLLRKSTKTGFDVMKAPLRRTFMKNLRRKAGSKAPPVPLLVPVPHSGMFLPKFNLLDQIKDLIASSDFQILDNLVVNPDPLIRFQKYITSNDDSFLEVHSGTWYMDTYDELVGADPGLGSARQDDWMFPLIFYVDKTGTDSLQRFPLEPLMFTTSVLKRHLREKASAWRHVGFVPQCDDAGASPEQVLQQFHHCMQVLLKDLVHLQQFPPTIQVVIDGTTSTKRLILPVAFVMGDQLSQDKHCGRKAVNAGGAGKIHRRCMCSYLDACCTTKPCIPVNKLEIDRLGEIARHDQSYVDSLVAAALGPGGSTKEKKTFTSYLKRRSKCARGILEKVYSTYPIENAWASVCFGANKEGIYGATLDDPMHYCDAGSFLYLAEVAFRSMTQGERLTMEEIIQHYFKGKRSSVREDLPRGKFSSGFSRTTLLTAGEKIGLIFSLFVTLGTEKGSSLFTSVLGRIQSKYEALPCRRSAPSEEDHLPKRGDIHFFADLRESHKSGRTLHRTLQGVLILVKSMIKHGLSFILERVENFDELQTEYLLQTVSSKIGNFVAPECYAGMVAVPGISKQQELRFAKSLFNKLRKDQGVLGRRQTCTSTTPAATDHEDHEQEDDGHEGQQEEEPSKKRQKKDTMRNVLVAATVVKTYIPKHELVRPKNTGNGPTSAILTDVEGFRRLLIKALSFHSYVHYFEEIPAEKRENIGLMNYFLRDFIGDYSRIMYRGDDTVDCNTPKMHCHLHLAADIHRFGHPMNWEAGKGERGLKVWAKLAGSTAQKVYLPVFTYQTALRVADAMLLSKATSMCAAPAAPDPEQSMQQSSSNEATEQPKVRMVPHYILDIETRATRHLSRKGKVESQPEMTSPPFDKQVVQAAILAEAGGLLSEIKIWKDAKVRIGGENKIIRSCSQYDRYGAFFDWVSVQFTLEDDNSCAPAKLLLIYEDSNSEMCGIVQACNWRNREEKKASTPLTSRWSMELLPQNEQPALRKIKLSEISEVLYVIEHSGQHKSQYGLNIPDGCGQRRGPQALRKTYCVDVVEPRYLWAENFLVASKNGTGGSSSSNRNPRDAQSQGDI